MQVFKLKEKILLVSKLCNNILKAKQGLHELLFVLFLQIAKFYISTISKSLSRKVKKKYYCLLFIKYISSIHSIFIFTFSFYYYC